MSTRSNIGVLEADGTIKAIYCHSDGYFSWNGRMLHDHHNSEAAARKIVSLGACSVLYERLAPAKGTPHSFENKQKGVSVFYKRDPGEDRMVDRYETVDDFLNNYEGYGYLWDMQRGAWIANCYPDDGGEFAWHLLSDLKAADWEEDGTKTLTLSPPVAPYVSPALEALGAF